MAMDNMLIKYYSAVTQNASVVLKHNVLVLQYYFNGINKGVMACQTRPY
jgi:hypothetical protein